MSDLLSVGISGLMAYRRALDTTSHNIANANTAGYSRQQVDLATRNPTATGAGFLGNGVDVNSVRRLNDNLIQARVTGDASAFGRLEVYAGTASRLDRLLSDPDAGLNRPLTQMFDAFNTLAQQPTSPAARQAVLSSAEGLSSQFRSLQGQLDGMSADLNAQLRGSVDSINTQSQAIAELNDRIALAYGKSGGQPPNDLLDARDARIAALAKEVGVQVVAKADGTVDVFTATGQSLVSSNTATPLSIAEQPDGRLDVLHAGRTTVTSLLSGGRLGGTLDAQRELVEPARAELGRLAAGLAIAINAQQADGVDPQGQPGGAIFAAPMAGVRGATGNVGNPTVAATIDNVSTLPTTPMRLQFDGANWQLSDARSGAALPMTGTGTAGDPFRGAGLSIVVGAGAVAGDRFDIEPTARVAGNLQVVMQDGSQLAAARASTLDANGNPQPTPPGSSDNGNAQALAALASRGLFGGGQVSIEGFHTRMVANTGLKAQQAGMQRDAQAAIQQQTLAERESVSGVNLDEEAADLIRFQQAYQAAARVIQVADSVFQTLLQAVRG